MAGGSLSSLLQSNTHTVPAAELLSSCTLRRCTHVAARVPQLGREDANQVILKSTHPLAGMTQSAAQLAGAGVNFLANVPTKHPVTQTTAGAQNWKWMRYWLFCRWSKQHHLSAAGWHKAQRNQSRGQEQEERGVKAEKMAMEAQPAIVAWELATKFGIYCLITFLEINSSPFVPGAVIFVGVLVLLQTLFRLLWFFVTLW